MRKVRWAVPLALQARCFPVHVMVYVIKMLAMRYLEEPWTIYRLEEVFQSCRRYHTLITHPCTSCPPSLICPPLSIPRTHAGSHPHSTVVCMKFAYTLSHSTDCIWVARQSFQGMALIVLAYRN